MLLLPTPAAWPVLRWENTECLKLQTAITHSHRYTWSAVPGPEQVCRIFKTNKWCPASTCHGTVQFSSVPWQIGLSGGHTVTVQWDVKGFYPLDFAVPNAIIFSRNMDSTPPHAPVHSECLSTYQVGQLLAFNTKSGHSPWLPGEVSAGTVF